jgi:hypothetical protein
MKQPFPISDFRFPIWKKSANSASAIRHSSFVTRHSQGGVALIITLILLAVVLFMALTFLAISRRERGAVTTTTDTISAQLTADNALAAAEGQIVANMLATNNPYNFGLLVSTNYINPNGFAAGVASPTNVNFDYYNTGPGPLSQGDFLQNLANLYYLPRTPVYMSNVVTRAMENRFYLDLNRNGFFETNGMVVDAKGTETNLEFGDPEWVGVLQHPDQPYGPNNPFVARYAFIAVPIGNTLDLNAVYNFAVGIRQQVNSINLFPDRFMRDQGVGSWEINLAAFLADLNLNQWGQVVGSGATAPPGAALWYLYNEANPNPPGPFANRGTAFHDALSLLIYRYNYDYTTLAPVGGPNPPGLFTNGTILPPFQNNIDYYSDAQPPMTTPAGINVFGKNLRLPWSGADNTNHFFDLQELYNPNETQKTTAPPGFTDRLLAAGAAFNPNPGPGDSDPTNFYNRYTYYRLVSQMGVDSAPAQNQINLNYANAVARFNARGVLTNITYVPNAETNLTPWSPLQFFTVAADRMLRDYSQQWLVESPSNYLATYGSFTNISTAANPELDPTNMPLPFGITNIPVYVNNQFVYTPAVQRVLQLAANIYDATTNRAISLSADFPSVFRPIFRVVAAPPPPALPVYTNVYIVSYEPVQRLGYNGLVPIGTVNGPLDPQLALPVSIADLVDPSPHTPNVSGFGPGLYTNINVYGVPWVVGAKKGFPNFNKFDLQSAFQLTRKLQVARLSTNDSFLTTPNNYSFNQMFNLSLSNQFGVECWNSYTNGYNDSMIIYARGNLRHAALSNDENFAVDLPVFPIFGFIQIPAGNVWPGYNPGTDPFGSLLSFQIPLNTNATVITNSMYRFNTPGNVEDPGYVGPYLTTNLTLPYEVNVSFGNNQLYPQPHWILTSSNELQVFMLDTSVTPNRVIDYVQLSGPNTTRDLTGEIITNYDAPVVSAQAGGSQLWNTNYQNGRPIGLLSQVGISMGSYTASANSGAWDQSSPTLLANEIAGFTAFMGYTPLPPLTAGQMDAVATAHMSNAMQAPYTPTATVVQHVSWQANDPLVHYTASDLNWGLSGASAIVSDRYVDTLTNNSPNGNLGALNQSYRPWGGNPLLPGEDQNPSNLTIKDPLVRQSDDWDFPTYRLPTIGWLGRVHRGTPWQTVYLKAPDVLRGIQVTGGVTNYVGTNVWSQWAGDTQLVNSQYYDAVNTAPAQDRLLFDIFSIAPNDNATRGQLPVNVGANDPNNPQAGLAAWSAVFSGVMALSNNAADPLINLKTGAPAQHNGSLANFTAFPIDPAGPAGLNSALGQLVAGINQTRKNFVNADGLAGSFEHAGDILAVPQLTSQSPFLNWKDPIQQTNGISDELYEWLPQQAMSLLRVSGSPRYVIYSYGQTLKPAPNSVYTGGGPFFGMVTNYQVVAEAATRAVVRFNGTRVNNVTNDVVNNSLVIAPSITNNNAVVEEFNVLPPN